MGGWIRPPVEGLPQWGPEADWNVQCDPRAAAILARTAHLTLVTLPATLTVWLRESHLGRLRATGAVGALLADQSELYARRKDWARLAASNPGLPPDLVNFLYDPATAAVALEWPGVRSEQLRLRPLFRDGILRFEETDEGRPTRVIASIDGDALSEYWLQTIERATWPAT
jgi:inosine-uridine nucleoside N-ribohydrolase